MSHSTGNQEFRQAHNPKVAGSSPAPAIKTGTLSVCFLLNCAVLDWNSRPKRTEPDKIDSCTNELFLRINFFRETFY